MDLLYLHSLVALRGLTISIIFFSGLIAAGALKKFADINLVDKITLKLTFFAFFLSITSAVVYLFYPGLRELGEVTIVSEGIKLFNGYALYPSSKDFFISATPYSPGIFLLIAAFSELNIANIVLVSKIPSFIAFLSTLALCYLVIKNKFCRKYLLIILIYGQLTFLVRPDIFILLASCLSIAFLELNNKRVINRLTAIILIAFTAGMASAVKIYGFIFCLSALILLLPMSIFQILAVILIIPCVFLMCFIPDGISINNFIESLFFFKTSFRTSILFIGNNLIFLILLLSPLFYLYIKLKPNPQLLLKISLLSLLEVLIALLGSKIGSGDYFLLPFIPINAYFIQRFLLDRSLSGVNNYSVNFGFIFIGLFCIALHLFNSIRLIASYPEQRAMASELVQIANQYPKVILGISDNNSYSTILLRPYLEDANAPQLDYAGYMEMDNAGVNVSGPLIFAFNNCSIEYVALYKHGAPFSFRNGYTFMPLFEDKITETFNYNYKKVETKEYFDIYSCANFKEGLSR